MSSFPNPGCLGYIGDETDQLYGENNKPNRIPINQSGFNDSCHTGFERCLSALVDIVFFSKSTTSTFQSLNVAVSQSYNMLNEVQIVLLDIEFGKNAPCRSEFRNPYSNTLPGTNSLHLKMENWETTFICISAYSQGQTASFREG